MRRQDPAGYVNVDVVEARAGMRPDVICDLHDLAPFADNSADEILSVHVVEHFWRWEVRDILREWVRVLKPGGRMIVECPNLQSACATFLQNPSSSRAKTRTGSARCGSSMETRLEGPAHDPPLGIYARVAEAVAGEVGLADVRQEPAQFKLREPRDMRIAGRNHDPSRRSLRALVPRNQCLEGHAVARDPHAQASERRLELPGDHLRPPRRPRDRNGHPPRRLGALLRRDARGARRARPRRFDRHRLGVAAAAGTSGIRFLVGDSAAPEMVERALALLPQRRGALFLILDSDHRRNHVLRELRAWVPVLR
jgi:SAM-dependent methyltransferase